MASTSNWVETIHPDSGKVYYYNKITRVTSWKIPNELIEASSNPKSDVELANNIGENWKESIDPVSGRVFYTNIKSSTTTWQRPSCMDAVDVKVKIVRAPTNNEETLVEQPEIVNENDNETNLGKKKKKGPWRCKKDPTTGRSFYFNKKTRETTWSKPSDFEADGDEQIVDAQLDDGDRIKRLIQKQSSSLSTMESSAQVDAVAVKQQQGIDDNEMKTNCDVSTRNQYTVQEHTRITGNDNQIEKQTTTLTKIQELNNNDNGNDDVDDAVDNINIDLSMIQFAQHRHGWLNRMLRIGKVFNDTQLLSFKKSLIKKALLKQNRDKDRQAVQAFKNLMSYMNDRKSSKHPIDHAIKLLSNGLKATSSLRDEMFLHICKQVTNHPNVQHAIRGWEMMSLYLGTFPPSNQLVSYLDEFFNRTIESGGTSLRIQTLVHECKQRMIRIVEMGQREAVPSKYEIQCLQQNKSLSIRVYQLDNQCKTVIVTPFTLVCQVKDEVTRQLGVHYAQPFAIYHVSLNDNNDDFYYYNDSQVIVEESMRILDVLSKWQCDNDDVWNDMVIDDAVDMLKPFRLVYKAHIVLKTRDKRIVCDAIVISLLYAQIQRDIVNGNMLQTDIKDCANIAAIQLQVKYGNFSSEKHSHLWIKQQLETLLPKHVLYVGNTKISEQTAQDLAQKIHVKYSKLTNVSEDDAKLSFLDYVQDWPLYGATFYLVEQKQLNEYPNPLIIGITCDAVHLCHPKSRVILESFTYQELVTWGFSDEKFILVVGSLVQRKLFFFTRNGKMINTLIHKYVQTKYV